MRFQRGRPAIEFLFRDAKQYAGLESCQARSENKIGFHVNTSLTAAKIANGDYKAPFSMANTKTMLFNELLLNRFLAEFGIDPNTTKNKQRILKLREFGKIAA